jgi:hypothetical protein
LGGNGTINASVDDEFGALAPGLLNPVAYSQFSASNVTAITGGNLVYVGTSAGKTDNGVQIHYVQGLTTTTTATESGSGSSSIITVTLATVVSGNDTAANVASAIAANAASAALVTVVGASSSGTVTAGAGVNATLIRGTTNDIGTTALTTGSTGTAGTNEVNFTATPAGAAASSLDIVYTAPTVTTASTTATVSGDVITVKLSGSSSGVSNATATAVASAINTAASSLVTATTSGTGIVTAQTGDLLTTASNLNTLTINGTLTWNPQPSVANVFHLSNTSNASDAINVLGSVDYKGNNSELIEFDFQDTGYFDGTDPETYTLLTSTSSLENLGFTLNQLVAENVWQGDRGLQGSHFAFSTNGEALEFVVVPEPSMWGLLAGGVMLLLGLRRKRALAKAAQADRSTQA